MPGIFISYRRRAGGYAGRLADDLARRYGKDAIFRDIEAIAAGYDFVEAIEKAVDSCDALIVLITPGWADVVDEKGRRRLDNPEDFARVEVESALKRDTWVIPVLVGGATMPASEELPNGLRSLARRQAHEIRDASWEFNIDQLVKTLSDNGIVPKYGPTGDSEPEPSKPQSAWQKVQKNAKIAAGGVAAIALLALAISLVTGLSDEGDGRGELRPGDGNVDGSPASTAGMTGGKEGTSPESTEPPPSKGVETGQPERRQPPPDPVATHRPAIEATLEGAMQAEILAFREMNPDYLQGVYEGEALDSLYSAMNVLQMNDLHAAPESFGRRFVSFDVSPDGTEARVEMVERNRVEFHTNMDDFCVGQVPVHDSHQTVYLGRSPRGWVIYRVDFHSTSPEPEAC